MGPGGGVWGKWENNGQSVQSFSHAGWKKSGNLVYIMVSTIKSDVLYLNFTKKVNFNCSHQKNCEVTNMSISLIL